MSAQTYQRNVTWFLAVHYIVSVVLVMLIEINALGGWLVFSGFCYTIAWMFLPYAFNAILHLWPEAKGSYYIPKIAAAVLTFILICGFSMMLDTHFTHLGLQAFVSLAAGLVAGFLRPVS